MDFLRGGGDMAALIRDRDWSASPLGSIDQWPQSLRTALSIVLASRFPMALWWGDELTQFYNDGYRPVLGALKHPASLGQRAQECWAEIWDVIGPMARNVLTTGEATWSADLLLVMERNGYVEETYFTFSYSAIRDESGGISGMLITCTETTERVLAERRLLVLRDLAARLADCSTVAETVETAMAVLAETGEVAKDVPFAALHLCEGARARCAGRVRLPPSAACPEEVELAAPHAEPIARVVESGRAEVVEVDERFGALEPGAWPERPRAAVILPVAKPGEARGYGALTVGVSPRRALDPDYRSFLDLVARQIATGVTAAEAHEAERRRAEQLAELDRAKTRFFSNASHELRTPLTLILGPLADALDGRFGPTPPALTEALAMTERNAQRLRKLVDTLLDFTRLEEGRARVKAEEVDVSALTRDLASAFAPAVDHAGLRLDVSCDPLPPAWVDPGMWEKITLNLLSNALKYTLDGRITVSLREHEGALRLEVTDTGVGIPAADLPRVFDRFYRVEGQRARTHEGSGIGLALVRELVELHGGRVEAHSAPGAGSRFVVSIPRATPAAAREPTPESPRASRPAAQVAARAYVEEALPTGAAADREARDARRPRVLLADDNADMRAYVARILAAHWDVVAVADGEEALEAARHRPPDVVVTDIMMPRMDGFGLLRELRREARTRDVPVLVLSARAGEEARVEGLDAGADDYLVKPFSARELVARVRVNLELSRRRLDADRRKDELFAVVGHELRNPLAPILTALEVMKVRGVVGGEREREVIERQVAHMMRLVDDLLDVARIVRGSLVLERKSLSVADVIDRAVEMASPLLERAAHHLELDVAPDLRVPGDAVRLAQVFSNLLTNACRYTPAGGNVRVTARREGDRVVVTVCDDGRGIDPSHLERVFEPFVQAERGSEDAAAGLGLGLPLVRSLVGLHGGTVEARSEGRGKGAELVVVLPYEDGAPDARSAQSFAAPGPSAASGKVLVVDDNEDAAEMLALALEQRGYEVAVAHDGPEALALAAGFRPQVAVIDIGLPVMDGYELARRLREQVDARLRLVAVTGYGQASDRRRSREAGIDAHLVKPVDMRALAAALIADAPAA